MLRIWKQMGMVNLKKLSLAKNSGRLDSRVVFTLDYNELRHAGPWAMRSILGDDHSFWLKHNIYAWKNFQKRRSEKEAERTNINNFIF